MIAERASDVWGQGQRCLADADFCRVDESEALDEIHGRTVDLLHRRESAVAIAMVAY